MTMKSRLSPLGDNISDAQQRVLDNILNGPRGNLDGPFLAWIKSPELAQNAQELGAFCRYKTGLGELLSELAILTTAAWWQSQAEWLIHEPIARNAGLSDTVITALQNNQMPDFECKKQKIVYQVCTTLYKTKRIPAELYEEAEEMLGEQQLVELIAILGYYALVAMTLNCFEMEPDKPHTKPF